MKFSKIRQLQKMSAGELRVRSKQELAKWQGRLLNRNVGEMSDSEFQKAVLKQHRGRNSHQTCELIAARIRRNNNSGRRFFPSASHRNEMIDLMRERFPNALSNIENSAQRAIHGYFDLLGYERLRFGESGIDWHLEPIAGKRTGLIHWSLIDYLNPGLSGDCKITWELNRHAHFVTLGQLYFVTGDERYAKAFVSQATSWMDANPPELGINWASSLELAFRTIAWLWSLNMLADSESLSCEFRLRFLKYLVQHGRHISEHLSYYFSPNTHLTGEALGLFYLGVALPELAEAAYWKDLGARILIEQLAIQVREDGVYFEQATYYHRYTTDFYLHFILLAEAARIELPAEIREKLSRLLDYLMWITRPDGSSPLIGDDDGGRLISLGPREPDDFRDTLAIGAAALGRSDLKYVASEAPSELLWLMGPDALRRYDQLVSEPPRELSRAFDESGYYVMRDGWERDSCFALIDCGPHGSLNCGHAHSDALAIEFSAQGKKWLIDPGTFVYTGDKEMRDWFRTTDAHNTVTIDGQPQSLSSGPFSWTEAAVSDPAALTSGGRIGLFKGVHNGYARLKDPVRHTRSVMFVRAEPDALPSERLNSYLIVLDSFDGLSQHQYSFSYHFPGSCTATATGNKITVTERDDESLTIAIVGETFAEPRVTRGWASNCYGKREPADIARFEADAVGPQAFTTVILPGINLKEISSLQTVSMSAEDSFHGFQIASADTLDVLLMNRRAVSSLSVGQIAKGELAWGRFISNKLIRACFICGHRFMEWTVESNKSDVDSARTKRAETVIEIEKALMRAASSGSIKSTARAPSKTLQGALKWFRNAGADRLA